MKLSQLFLESRKSHKGVGVFLQLPDGLGKDFPKLSQDDSPSHVTALYLGDQSSADEVSVLGAIKRVAKTTAPFIVRYGDLGHFHHKEDNEKVAFVKIHSTGLRKLRQRLTRELKRDRVKWEDKWGAFKPHITLAYMKGNDKYDGKIPTGQWKCRELRIWGFKKKHTIKLEG
jgi:2'-5' RNA ligase